jgi:hypothetical protein
MCVILEPDWKEHREISAVVFGLAVQAGEVVGSSPTLDTLRLETEGEELVMGRFERADLGLWRSGQDKASTCD